MPTNICTTCGKPWMDAKYTACPDCNGAQGSTTSSRPLSSPAATTIAPTTTAAAAADAARKQGFTYLGIAGAIFIGCSIVQAMGGSNMFSSSFTDPDNPILEFLMQLTWWPGWIAIGYFGLFGAAMILTGRKLR